MKMICIYFSSLIKTVSHVLDWGQGLKTISSVALEASYRIQIMPTTGLAFSQTAPYARQRKDI